MAKFGYAVMQTRKSLPFNFLNGEQEMPISVFMTKFHLWKAMQEQWELCLL